MTVCALAALDFNFGLCEVQLSLNARAEKVFIKFFGLFLVIRPATKTDGVNIYTKTGGENWCRPGRALARVGEDTETG